MNFIWSKGVAGGSITRPCSGYSSLTESQEHYSKTKKSIPYIGAGVGADLDDIPKFIADRALDSQTLLLFFLLSLYASTSGKQDTVFLPLFTKIAGK